MEQTNPQNSIEYLKIDPNGDTLITLLVEDTQSTSADDTGIVLPSAVTRMNESDASEPGTSNLLLLIKLSMVQLARG
jgi:hypothetical protein